MIGCHEFSSQRTQDNPRHKRAGSSASASLHKMNSTTLNQGGGIENDNVLSMDEAQTPSKLYRGTMVRSLSQGNLDQFKPATEPRKNSELFFEDLPHFSLGVWQTGFVWRGVHLKLLSKKKAKRLKAEIKALKQVAVEYLQTECITKFQDFQGNFSLINESLQDIGNKSTYSSNIYLNFILPLIAYCESSSWILIATPFINNKKLSIEEFLQRANYEVGTSFKNSILMSNLNFLNLKCYAKSLDESCNSNNSTNLYSPAINSFNLIITNSLSLAPTHEDLVIPFIINEEYDSNIIYLESTL